MIEDILEREDREYHTKPFLSGKWGGIYGYNVPQQKLQRLMEALEVIAPQYAASGWLEVRGWVVDDAGITFYIPQLTEVVKYFAPFASVTVLIRGDEITVHPSEGVWQEVRIHVKED